MIGSALTLSDTDPARHLPEALIRHLLSITPQLRRTHIDCFAGLDLHEARNDDVFYAHLTTLWNVEAEAILRFDRALLRDKKREKTVALRARRALVAHIGPPESPEAEAETPAGAAGNQDLPIEARQLAWLLLRLSASSQTAGKVKPGEATSNDPALSEPGPPRCRAVTMKPPMTGRRPAAP